MNSIPAEILLHGNAVVAGAPTWQQCEEQSGGERHISYMVGGGGGAGNEGAHQMGKTSEEEEGEEGKEAEGG